MEDRDINLEDIMIRATLKREITKEDILKANECGGLMAVYNLGLEVMYKYLKEGSDDMGIGGTIFD